MRPLPGGKVLIHLHFVSQLGSGANRHHRIFSKAVDQLVRWIIGFHAAAKMHGLRIPLNMERLICKIPEAMSSISCCS